MNWNTLTTETFPVGSQHFGGKLTVVSVDERRISLTRNATGKPVTVSRAMIEKAHAHISEDRPCIWCDCGERGILKRKISYTSAIEAVVIEALGSLVTTADHGGLAHYVRAQA